MATLPENRTTANTPAEHVADHNELHRLHNLLDGHLADATDAHDAQAISFAPTGTIAATDVQAAIAEVAAEAGGGVTDHGALTGLADDDHPQYQKTSQKDAANGYPGLDAGAKILLARMSEVLSLTDLLDVVIGGAAAGEFLRHNGTNWVDSVLQPGDIPNDAVTYARMQNVSAASRLLGRGSASGAGDPEEISIGSGLTLTGTTLAASGGASTTHTLLRKTADESVTSSTGLVNIAGLGLTVAANEVWIVDVFCWVSGSTAGDVKFAFTFPTLAEFYWSRLAVWNAGISLDPGAYTTGSGSVSSGVGGTSNSLTYLFHLHGIYVGGSNGGTLQPQFAQNTSDPTATTVKAQSHLLAHKV